MASLCSIDAKETVESRLEVDQIRSFVAELLPLLGINFENIREVCRNDYNELYTLLNTI